MNQLDWWNEELPSLPSPYSFGNDGLDPPPVPAEPLTLGNLSSDWQDESFSQPTLQVPEQSTIPDRKNQTPRDIGREFSVVILGGEAIIVPDKEVEIFERLIAEEDDESIGEFFELLQDEASLLVNPREWMQIPLGAKRILVL